MNRKLLIEGAAVALLAALVGAGYWLAPRLLPKADVSVQPEPGCDLHRSPCGAELPGGGRVQLSVSPRPIPLVAPLEVEVRVEGRRADRVELDFSGAAMDMGLNRIRLEEGGGGRFVGQGSIPICVTGPMEWRATVLVESGRERIAVPFGFASGRGGR